jgi:hypothetical protein
MLRERLIAMFEEMVVHKDASAIAKYYDPEFVLISNGITQDYAAYVSSHEGMYDTEISYHVEYDDQAWVESDDRLAARVWITTARPDEKPTRIEVVLISIWRDGRILTLWELTWPNWSELPAFDDYRMGQSETQT